MVTTFGATTVGLPVTIPLVPTVASAVLVEDQAPPLDGVDNVMLLPAHTFTGPEIGLGDGITVTGIVK